MRAWFAPGKMVLAGEYAVLDGGPALVAAVGHGVACEFSPGAFEILTPDGDTRFVAPALEGAPPGRYRFRSHPGLDLPGKPGFGGSAAACVVACLAAGRPALDAREIHARVQGGGSGVDVLASALGGMLRVEGGKASSVELAMPVVVYSGRSASTGPRVQQYLGWSGREAFLRDSEEAVALLLREPIAGARAALAALQRMSEQAGIDYLSPGLARIVELARAHGGAAKPSGAGGGDVAVAWLPDEEAERAFRAACEAQGLPVIEAPLAGPAGALASPDPGVSSSA